MANRIIICQVCKKHRQVAYGFMTSCHTCTPVRELRRRYQSVTK